MSILQRFSLASFIAIAASAAACAADLAPTPAPVGLAVYPAARPRGFHRLPGRAKRLDFADRYIRPPAGRSEPFVSPDDGFGIALLDLRWIKAGPVGRFISERTLSGGFGTLATTTASTACIMSASRPNLAVSGTLADRLLPRPLGGAPGRQRRRGLRRQRRTRFRPAIQRLYVRRRSAFAIWRCSVYGRLFLGHARGGVPQRPCLALSSHRRPRFGGRLRLYQISIHANLERDGFRRRTTAMSAARREPDPQQSWLAERYSPPGACRLHVQLEFEDLVRRIPSLPRPACVALRPRPAAVFAGTGSRLRSARRSRASRRRSEGSRRAAPYSHAPAQAPRYQPIFLSGGAPFSLSMARTWSRSARISAASIR